MDDKWGEHINWDNVQITVDTETIRELQRMAFEFEEQQAAVQNFVEEFPEGALKLLTGYDMDCVAEAFNKVFQSMSIVVNELAEGLVKFLGKTGMAARDALQQSLPDIIEALQAIYQYCEDERDQRFWKSYRCTWHRRQNIRAFQKLPYGYQAPLPVRNNRTMIRRTI